MIFEADQTVRRCSGSCEAIVHWPLADEAELKRHSVFQERLKGSWLLAVQESPHEGAAERWDLLKKRVVQHNIKALSSSFFLGVSFLR